MEAIAHLETATTPRDDAFHAVVGQHYGGLVRRLTAIVRDPDAGQDPAFEAGTPGQARSGALVNAASVAMAG